MKPTKVEIIEKIIDEISDWDIIKVIINKYEQEEMAIKQRKQQIEVVEQEAKDRREKARYNRPIYYQESAMERGHRMRRHNDTVASQGYGSSYF